MSTTINFENILFIDLTHVLTPDVPSWGGGCSFHHEITLDYDDCTSGTEFRVQGIKMGAGVGTHIDAPLHCIRGAMDVASLPLHQLITPCVVIDVSSIANETYSVTPNDVRHFEMRYGKIKKNTFVIVRTGWDKFWSEPDNYRNNLQFPTISLNAAELLLERDIAGLGIDTLSPESDVDGFPVHRLILGKGKYIIENIANTSLIPPIGAHTLALPLKIQDGTESPIRLIAAVAKKK